MDSALRLLFTLRLRAAFRRIGRAFSSAKGALLAAVGLAIFLPQGIIMLLTPAFHSPAVLEGIRRFGPLVLAAYALLILLTPAAERSIAFSPAEVDFLFPAPFSRRRLLAYKVGGQLLGCLVFGLVMGLFAWKYVSSPIAALAGSVLSMIFLQMLAVAVGLLAQTAGVIARTGPKRLILLGLGVVLAAALAQSARGLTSLPPLEALRRLESSAAVRAMELPLRPFSDLIAVERLWPDALAPAALGLAIDLALLVVVFALDAQYLESAATNSAKLYEQLERMRRGGIFASQPSRSGKKRASVMPDLPWMGGVGPVAWRQLTAAQRDVGRTILALISYAFLIVPMVAVRFEGREISENLMLGFESIVLGMSVLCASLLPFDFRADFDRLPELKALPVRPIALAVGQVLTPVGVLSALQAITLGLMAVVGGHADWIFWALGAFALPINATVVGIDNLWAVLFPSKPMAAGTFDVQALGRAMLLMLAKVTLGAVAAGLALGLGAAAYFLTGRGLGSGLALGWLAMTAVALSPIPLIALAFRNLDVARDTPA